MPALMDLAKETLALMGQMKIMPLRLVLRDGGRALSLSLLRGGWGAALHQLDKVVYDKVFHPQGHEATPLYLLRAAPRPGAGQIALDWILFPGAFSREAVLIQAWQIALAQGLGLGPRPVEILSCRCQHPNGQLRPDGQPWSLDQVSWPLAGHPETTPCRLNFPEPLRLLRQSQLIHQPSLADLTVAAVRRLSSFLGQKHQGSLRAQKNDVLEEIRPLPGIWTGSRKDLCRFSARQDRDLQLHGVTGCLELPEGPGPAWPLLAAAQWLHLGKGTVFGMGRVEIESL